METSKVLVVTRQNSSLLTSSEVELMETPRQVLFRLGIGLLTSSEVELMET